jgi:hypothetical protein
MSRYTELLGIQKRAASNPLSASERDIISKDVAKAAFRRSLEKDTARHIIGGGVAKGLVHGSTVAALLGLTYGAAHAGEKAYGLLSERVRLKKLLERNPDLKDKSPKDVKEMFKIIHDYSPSLTKHPAVAGSFVRRALEVKDIGVAPASIKELADIHGSIGKGHAERGRFTGALRSMQIVSPTKLGED